MKLVYRLAEGLVQRALGSPVDAGACVTDIGCCCGPAGYGFNCYGHCVRQPCRHCS